MAFNLKLCMGNNQVGGVIGSYLTKPTLTLSLTLTLITTLTL